MGLGFEDLETWKRCAAFSSDIYKYFNNCRDFGFKDQITRSSLSVPSNIAEGYERDSFKEKKHFYTIAKSSAGELRTQIYIGIKIGYIDKKTGANWIKESKEISAMIVGLINSLPVKK